MLKVLDLFSGIGGFSLGLERAGMQTIAFCEIEDFPRKVLRKHWPDVPIFEDVRRLHAADLPSKPDVIVGGYPCQPFSLAGKREGKEDDRHLWPEIVRLIRELDATGDKPTWCVFENVAGHVSMGLDQVLSDLESEGYAVWTFIIPACALNAPHRRDRTWIIAHYESGANREHNAESMQRQEQELREGPGGKDVANPTHKLLHRSWTPRTPGWHEFTDSGHASTNANHQGPQGRRKVGEQETKREAPGRDRHDFAGSDFGKLTRGEWTTQPPVCSGDDGLPSRVARLKALGNAVIPQIPELIGRAILAA